MKVWPGRPCIRWGNMGWGRVNVSLFSENATSVELCLFDGPDASQESHRIRVEERTNQAWHAYLPERTPWPPLRVSVSSYDPPAGHRFNPAKLLLDPMPNPSPIPFRLSDHMFGYQLGDAESDLVRDDRDNAKICRSVSWWIKPLLGASPAPRRGQNSDLQGARQGIHGQASACAGTFTWHVCRVIDAGGH